jgi:copper(I)-binding protein
MPQSAASPGSTQSAAGPIVVTGAYVRAPVPPTQIAAAYFTVYNTSNADDRLSDVQTGAGADSVLHTVAPDGSMSAAANGALIPAHGRLVLSTGKAHVMIEHLFGKLVAGQTVNLELDFQKAGSIDVVAPVIAVGAPAPTAAPQPSGAPS